MAPPTLLKTVRQEPTSTLLIACEPRWVYATESLFNNDYWILVYRSTETRDDDEDYEPVRTWLAHRSWSVVSHDEFPDEDMMFGRAELWVYRLRK